MNIALDSETYYSKTYSIRDLGNHAYVNHPEFNCYLITLAFEDGRPSWAGHPQELDTSILEGHSLIMHNAGFDTAVVGRLVEQGIIAPFNCVEIFDTADLAAYLGFPRSLAAATKGLLGLEMDKSARDEAKGKSWAEMDPAFKEKMLKYATFDPECTLNIWLKWGHKWPEWERVISRITREMCATGLPVDLDGVNNGIAELQTLLWSVRNQIPWAAGDSEAKALSPKAFAEECRKHSIEPPKSMAKDSETFDAWLKQNGDALPWARAIGQYRSINMLLKKLMVMQTRTYVGEDGNPVMPYALKYCGAHTLRDSGDAGFNPQNMPRDRMFVDELSAMRADLPDAKFEGEPGIDLRELIMAPPGHTLGVVDLSAIEPCSLAVLSGDEELVALLESGMDPYEAQARLDGEYDGAEPLKDVDKVLRQYNKVKVLGCGYGAGAEKVQFIAKTMVGIELTMPQTEALVARFRARTYIPGLWRTLERAMRSCAGREDFTMGLPSGGEMRYRDVRNYGSLSAVIPRQGRFMRLKFWGGTLVENLVQRCARDVFMDCVLRLYDAGLPPILRVHDEAVCVLPKKTAKEDLTRMIKIMSTRPTWMPDLPLRAEGHLCDRYTKG